VTGFSTDAIHAGNEPDPTTGAVSVPIFQTSTYVQPELGRHKGYEYARTANPTRRALEENLAVLERGAAGRCFASGMAAISAVATFAKAGDHVVVSDNTYGGTFRLYSKILAHLGVAFSFVDTRDPENVRRAMRDTTRFIHLETPTNPMMSLCDIAAIAEVAKARNAGVAAEKRTLVVVDNTFATPYFQRPLELGADIVVHSTTKFLNGHSDSVGGAAISKTKELDDWLGFVQNSAGAILSPFDSWLVLRGVKTLAVRMDRHEANGRAVAAFLDAEPKVRRVYYPGLASHPQHALAKKQMRGFGALISFDVGSYENAKALLDTVKICSLGESLGGVETLICHPATMTHASVPEEDRAKLGITPGLVRISVGIEDEEDLLADLGRALSAF
jgi:cystathionine gamma-lyase/cystathionine beta-lyase/cystathionine gamma-lyase/homocysteine desulfhydrase